MRAPPAGRPTPELASDRPDLFVYLPHALSEDVVPYAVRRPSVRWPGGFVRFLELLSRGVPYALHFSRLDLLCPPWPRLYCWHWASTTGFPRLCSRKTLCVYELPSKSL